MTSLLDARELLTRRAFQALNAVVVPAVKAGIGSPLPVGVGLVVLETTGRSSGKQRHVPLLAARLGDKIAVSTVRGSSQWAKNLEAEPEAAVWVDGRKRCATGTIEPGTLTVASIELG